MLSAEFGRGAMQGQHVTAEFPWLFPKEIHAEPGDAVYSLVDEKRRAGTFEYEWRGVYSLPGTVPLGFRFRDSVLWQRYRVPDPSLLHDFEGWFDRALSACDSERYLATLQRKFDFDKIGKKITAIKRAAKRNFSKAAKVGP
jgi:hypothetical protein